MSELPEPSESLCFTKVKDRKENRYPRIKAKSLSEANRAITAMQATITELTTLLKVAECPQCDGSGAYYGQMGDIHQCQWCDERAELLPEFTEVDVTSLKEQADDTSR